MKKLFAILKKINLLSIITYGEQTISSYSMDLFLQRKVNTQALKKVHSSY